MKSENYYRASDLYSQPATETAPARRGMLPVARTQFYKLLKEGVIAQPDKKLGNTKMWSESFIQSFVQTNDSA